MAYIFLLESNYLSIYPQTRKYSLFYVTVSKGFRGYILWHPLNPSPRKGQGKNPFIIKEKTLRRNRSGRASLLQPIFRLSSLPCPLRNKAHIKKEQRKTYRLLLQPVIEPQLQPLQISFNSPFFPWLARHRVSVQACVPEGRAGPGQEDSGEGHREAGPPHLLLIPARPPHRP